MRSPGRPGSARAPSIAIYPPREDLLTEVYCEDVDELVATAPALLEQHGPLQALARWLDWVADYARVRCEVFAALEVGVWRDLSAHSLGPIGDALTLIRDAGKTDDTIRRSGRPGSNPPTVILALIPVAPDRCRSTVAPQDGELSGAGVARLRW